MRELKLSGSRPIAYLCCLSHSPLLNFNAGDASPSSFQNQTNSSDASRKSFAIPHRDVWRQSLLVPVRLKLSLIVSFQIRNSIRHLAAVNRRKRCHFVKQPFNDSSETAEPTSTLPNEPNSSVCTRNATLPTSGRCRL